MLYIANDVEEDYFVSLFGEERNPYHWPSAIEVLETNRDASVLLPHDLFDILDDIEMASVEFVSNLDRSPLGDFALPSNVVTAMDTYHRQVSYVGTRRDHTGIVGESLSVANIACASVGVPRHIALAEISFWWRLYDFDMYAASRAGGVRDTYGEASRLAMIHERPDLHEYFAAGVWDSVFAQKCIDDDIDASLALTMLGLSSGVGSEPYKRIYL